MPAPTVDEVLSEALSVVGLDPKGDLPQARCAVFFVFSASALPFLMRPLNFSVRDAGEFLGYAASLRPSHPCHGFTRTPAGVALQVEMLKGLLARVRQRVGVLATAPTPKPTEAHP